jgi:hypothetical protein
MLLLYTDKFFFAKIVITSFAFRKSVEKVMLNLQYKPEENLFCEPAIGFQTAGCNANWVYAFRGLGSRGSTHVRNSRIKDIALKIFGYIPGIGIFVGIYRLTHIAKQNGYESQKHKIRGVMEIFPL